MWYSHFVIKSFKHKGLRTLFESGKASGVQPSHARRLRIQFAALDTAQEISDMDLPGYRLHPLKGGNIGRWSITVTGNWRMTFEFRDGNAYVLDYEDYH
jgi:proteic killer suppression protein